MYIYICILCITQMHASPESRTSKHKKRHKTDKAQSIPKHIKGTKDVKN